MRGQKSMCVRCPASRLLNVGMPPQEVIVDVQDDESDGRMDRISYWQTLARVWVRSAFTELLVAIFLILDLSMAA